MTTQNQIIITLTEEESKDYESMKLAIQEVARLVGETFTSSNSPAFEVTGIFADNK